MRYFFGRSERPTLNFDDLSKFHGSVLDSRGKPFPLEFVYIPGEFFSMCFNPYDAANSISISVKPRRALLVPGRVRHGSDARPASSIELVFRVPFSPDIIYSIKITKAYIDVITYQDNK